YLWRRREVISKALAMTETPRHRVAASEIFLHYLTVLARYQARIYSKSKGNLASRFDRVDDDQQGKVQRLRVGGRPPGSGDGTATVCYCHGLRKLECGGKQSCLVELNLQSKVCHTMMRLG
ncbi:unnamed protein product, partial [Brassica rapa subsp. narinosa]